MGHKLDYRWHLRKVMATHEMFQTTDLIGPLAERGITVSSSQVYRLVTERLSMRILMALLDILDCATDDLIEPVADASAAAKPKKKAAAGGRGRRDRRLAAQTGPDRAGGQVTNLADEVLGATAL